MSLIVHNFDIGEQPLTAKKLSAETKTPARLTQKVLNKLEQLGFIHKCEINIGKCDIFIALPGVAVVLIPDIVRRGD